MVDPSAQIIVCEASRQKEMKAHLSGEEGNVGVHASAGDDRPIRCAHHKHKCLATDRDLQAATP